MQLTPEELAHWSSVSSLLMDAAAMVLHYGEITDDYTHALRVANVLSRWAAQDAEERRFYAGFVVDP